MARLLVLRAADAAARTAEALRARGHDSLLAPLFHTVATGLRVPQGPCEAVLATSRRAIDNLHPDDRAGLAGLPLLAVGESTAAVARTAGFAEVLSGEGDALALARLAVKTLPPGARLLYLAGEPRKPELEQALLAKSFRLDTAVVYRMSAVTALPPEAGSALAAGTLDGVLHFSRHGAAVFAGLAADAGQGQQAAALPHYCLSADVAAGLAALAPARVAVAGVPRASALYDLIAR